MWTAVAIVAVLVLYFIAVYNGLIARKNQAREAFATIDTQLKRRYDLIPNLVDCVKAYDKHEYDTLMAVVDSRGTKSDAAVAEITTQIKAVAEAYPELQSSSNYKELMNELSTTENKIANVRTNYNTWVTKYNAYVKRSPNKQILGLMGYEKGDYQKLDFKVSDDAPINLFD